MKRFFLQLNLALLPALLFATGSNVPKGWWQCSYKGSEWTMVPGPNGTPQQQLQPRVYSSNWNKSRSVSNDEALDSCNNWSDTGCRFISCKQRNRR